MRVGDPRVRTIEPKVRISESREDERIWDVEEKGKVRFAGYQSAHGKISGCVMRTKP